MTRYVIDPRVALHLAQHEVTVPGEHQLVAQAQLALEGLRPADYLDTRTGFEIMSQLMGSMRSGAYQ